MQDKTLIHIKATVLRCLGGFEIFIFKYLRHRSFVVLLLRGARPPTVPRFVIPVVIDSIEAAFRRLMTHVGKEVFKGLSPSFTYRYTTPAIVWVRRIVLVVATLLHLIPTFVLRCTAFPMSSTAPSKRGRGLTFKAPATQSVVAKKTVGTDYLFVTAIATTQPLRIAIAVCGVKRNGNQSTKALSGYICSSWFARFLVFHMRILLLKVKRLIYRMEVTHCIYENEA